MSSDGDYPQYVIQTTSSYIEITFKDTLASNSTTVSCKDAGSQVLSSARYLVVGKRKNKKNLHISRFFVDMKHGLDQKYFNECGCLLHLFNSCPSRHYDCRYPPRTVPLPASDQHERAPPPVGGALYMEGSGGHWSLHRQNV